MGEEVEKRKKKRKSKPRKEQHVVKIVKMPEEDGVGASAAERGRRRTVTIGYSAAVSLRPAQLNPEPHSRVCACGPRSSPRSKQLRAPKPAAEKRSSSISGRRPKGAKSKPKHLPALS